MCENECVKPNAYYFDLIREVDQLSRKPELTVQRLPPESIWNKFKLASVNTAKNNRPHCIVFDHERDLKRIEASVACEMMHIRHTSKDHSFASNRFSSSQLDTPRERYEN